MFNSLFARLKSKSLISFSIIFILSLIPRFIMLFTSRQVGFGPEQGLDLLFAKNIIVDKVFPLVGYNGGYIWHIPKGAGWYYLLSIPFVFGNGDPFWAKAMTGIVSIATIILSFFVVKSVFNLRTAVSTCILLAISPWLIEITGQIWPPYIVIFPVVIFLYAVMKFLQKKPQFAILIALSIGLMMQFEIAIAYFYLVLMLALVPLAIKYKYLNFKTLFFSCLVLFLFFIPNIIYDLTNGFYSANGFSILINKSVNGGISNTISFVGQRIDVFTYNFRSTLSYNILKSICLFLIMYTGVYLYVKDRKNIYSKKLFIVFLASVPVTKFILFLFYPGIVQAWHLLDLTVIYCFILGIILGYFLEKPVLKILAVAVLIGLIIICSTRMRDIFRSEFFLSFGINRIAQSAPVSYIFNDAKKQPFNYIQLDKSQQRYDFDYLFWWYGAKEYGYQPSIAKQKLRYYIQDEHYANQKSFPKNLGGRVINTKTFQNGYDVIKVVY